MDTHTNDQLLMCEKQDLVKYITELKKQFEVVEQSPESSAYAELEIEKLKKGKERFRHLHSQVSCENEELNKDNEMLLKGLWIGPDNRKTTVGRWRAEYEEKIEKLKAKIAEIPDLLEKERYEERECNERDYKDLNEEENEKLLKKIEELQEQLNEESAQRLKNKECWMSVQGKYKEQLLVESFWRCYMEWVDPKCQYPSPDKEHVDTWCGEDDKLKEYLYDQFGIEEEEECGKCGQLSSDEKGQGCKECCPSDDE